MTSTPPTIEMYFLYQALIVAIVTGWASAIDIKLLVNGHPVWTVMPYPGLWGEGYQSNQYDSQPFALSNSGHSLKTLIASVIYERGSLATRSGPEEILCKHLECNVLGKSEPHKTCQCYCLTRQVKSQFVGLRLFVFGLLERFGNDRGDFTWLPRL